MSFITRSSKPTEFNKESKPPRVNSDVHSGLWVQARGLYPVFHSRAGGWSWGRSGDLASLPTFLPILLWI